MGERLLILSQRLPQYFNRSRSINLFSDMDIVPVIRGVQIHQDDQRLRPYHVEYTSSRPITEVKQRRARLVLGWVTAWEYRVS